MATQIRPLPPALPTTTEELLGLRKLKTKRTLNDMVEELHLELYEHDGYARLLEGVHNEHTVEGTVALDHAQASEMIRERGNKKGQTEVANAKLAAVLKSLHVTLRRYGISVAERRKLIAPPPDQLGQGTHVIKDGKVVPIENEI